MNKATISILRTNGGTTDVTINTFGDAPTTATITMPDDVAALLARELAEGAFASFKWSNE